MAQTDLTLKCSSVNGGTAVNLQGVELTYGWNNYVSVPDVASKFAATDAQVETDFNGWTNPKIVLRGVIDVNDATSNSLTIALLKSFTKEKTNPIYITEQHLFPVADTNMVQIMSFTLKKIKSSFTEICFS